MKRSSLRPGSSPKRRRNLDEWPAWTPWLLILAMLYLLVSTARYRFTHPEQTETELLLNLWEALTWR